MASALSDGLFRRTRPVTRMAFVEGCRKLEDQYELDRCFRQWELQSGSNARRDARIYGVRIAPCRVRRGLSAKITPRQVKSSRRAVITDTAVTTAYIRERGAPFNQECDE